MTKQILPTIIRVTQSYQQVFFSVILPKDTLYVAKIQTGVRLPLKGSINNGIAGTLQLQSIGVPNICYYTEVKTDTTPVGLQIFGFSTGTKSTLIGRQGKSKVIDWMQQPFIQWEKQVAEDFYIKGNNMMYGCYRDEVGGANADNINYTINLFLHLVLKS